MAAFFIDSSALAKRYVSETGTPWMQALTDPASGNSLYVARITLVELVAAVSRRRKSGHLTPADAAAALSDVRADFASDYRVIEITTALVTQAEALADRHTLRGYDAVQLAAAVQVNDAHTAAGLPAVTLISADLELNAAASIEGLGVDDPNTH